ncbi:TGF-beta-activated kinase 1 and MAP3K7-binding protein 1-like [Lycorma delicatula]|uniref:TGF-beta-activated kinase 1 and MAP3K7-binding protein 1-like n=1 Tax=Lycorma delicatula TaxID=130591 RepID=UPI003F517A50
MPTRAELPRSMGYEEQYSWTDDLPVCKQSGVGYSTNQIYREDGHRREEHPFEDTSFHCRVDDNTCLYGVFDGHNGVKTAKFALESLASEILLDTKLGKKTNDDEIREALVQAFVAVEKSYLESIDDRLAERTSLIYEIPEGIKPYEAYKSHPHVVEKLNSLNYELSCGTSAVIAYVTNGLLFVANVGDSRALLCKTDENGVLRVIQLSVDHDLSNEDELLRLYNLGLRFDNVFKGSRLGNQKNTRCLGNYLVKGAYKEFEELAAATSEPITAEPEIHGGIKLDSSCRFLLLMSYGLYKSLEEATGIDHDQVNKRIAEMVVKEFRVQSTLVGVAQAVVDKVVRIHHDMYMSGEERGQGSRDDMTLLLRNFNFPLPNALSSPSSPIVRFDSHPTVSELPMWAGTQSDKSEGDTTVTNSTENTTSSSGESYTAEKKANEKITPYVDFTEYYKNVELAKLEGTLPEGIEF